MFCPLRRSALCGLCLLAVTLTGCRDDPNGGVDHAFIRTGEENASSGATPAPPPAPAVLFPTAAGRRWEMMVRAQAGGTGRIQAMSETTTATGPATIASVAGKALLIQQKGAPSRSELFSVTDKGLSQIAAGGAQKMVMSPPMPLFAAPITAGASLSWEGEIRFMGAKAPGTGFSRVSGKDLVQTPAGKFEAWRIDSILTTLVQGRQVSFPITRWMAPGVGVVKQRYILGNAIVVKELTSYTKK